MPQMANITVKDDANLDVVYSMASPSAGDRSPAVWRANAKHAVVGFRPTYTLTTRDNARQNGRVLEAHFKYPIVAAINGTDTLLATVPFTLTGTLPTNVDAAKVKDAFTQLGNLISSLQSRSTAEDGYAPS